MLRKGVANQGKRLTQIRRQSANVGASVAVKVNSLASNARSKCNFWFRLNRLPTVQMLLMSKICILAGWKIRSQFTQVGMRISSKSKLVPLQEPHFKLHQILHLELFTVSKVVLLQAAVLQFLAPKSKLKSNDTLLLRT